MSIFKKPAYLFACVAIVTCAQAQESQQARFQAMEGAAKHAVVVAYGWSDQDQSTQMLLADEKFGGRRWTSPGGTIEDGQTAAQAAAQELYEETSGYDAFHPSKTQSRIDRIDHRHKLFTGYNNNTVTYFLYLEEGVDNYKNIKEGVKERLDRIKAQNPRLRMYPFQEMVAWSWVPVSDMQRHMNLYKDDRVIPEGKSGFFVNLPVILNDTVYPIRNIAYRAFQKFAKRRDGFNMLLSDMASGLEECAKEIKKKKPFFKTLGDMLFLRHAGVLNRGPSTYEFSMMCKSLETYAASSNKILKKEENVQRNAPEKAHQEIMWAVVNVLRDPKQRHVYLQSIPEKNTHIASYILQEIEKLA